MMTHAEAAPVILLVDDEQMIRNLLRVALQRYGYGVLEASNSSELCAAIPKELNRYGCIPKPFLPAEIIERVAQIVPKPD
jgi:PleD family two-component response regulator